MTRDQDGPDQAMVARMRRLVIEGSFYLQAVADRLGMAATDFTCLTVLLLDGPASAGELAERTGLTSGAITGVVDRLERGGWVQRAPDPADRRRVIVSPKAERADRFQPLLAPMLTGAAELQARFTQSERAVVARYVEAATGLLADHVHRLRAAGADGTGWTQLGGGDVGTPGSDEGSIRVPRDGVDHAHLQLDGLAIDLQVGVGALGEDLCVVEYTGRPPAVVAHAGWVQVRSFARGRRRWHLAGANITVNRDVRWTLGVAGGASKFRIDLRGALLDAVSVSGGASEVELHLPTPDRAVPIQVKGGASQVRISRPADVPVSVAVRGGTMAVTLDGTRVTPWRGPNAAPQGLGPVRYQLDVSGGASAVDVVSAR